MSPSILGAQLIANFKFIWGLFNPFSYMSIFYYLPDILKHRHSLFIQMFKLYRKFVLALDVNLEILEEICLSEIDAKMNKMAPDLWCVIENDQRIHPPGFLNVL